MSGGVDSSAAAWLLQQQGHEVIGLLMRSGAVEEAACKVPAAGAALPELPLFAPKAHKQGCCSAADAEDARRVADRLDIPFYALDFADAFGQIKDYFADEYLAGRTPNPCVMCNNWLKFGKLWEFADQIGADHIATGHYAQILPTPAGRGLFRGLDPDKDQSYVLFGIRPQLLNRILFPVGDRNKTEIRQLAREAGLRTADKPDSQEICFIPNNDYGDFLKRYRDLPSTAGELVDSSGRVVGQHDGYEKFTIGQRRGLGAFGGPRFVVRIEANTRRVVIGEKSDLARNDLTANRLNWLGAPPAPGQRYHAQIRYQHTAAACEIELPGDDQMRVQFTDPQFGVAPGQAVVIYEQDRVLGGGWIAS